MTKNINLTDRINAQFNLCNATLIVTRTYCCGHSFGMCYRLLQGGVERKGSTLLMGIVAAAPRTFIQMARLLAASLGIASELDVYQSIRVVPGMGGSYESAAVVFPAAIAPTAQAQVFAMMVAEHATLKVGEVQQKQTRLDYGLNVLVIVNGARHSKLYPSGLDYTAVVRNQRTGYDTHALNVRRNRMVDLYKVSIMRLVAHTNK